jgi:hypothetical protein
MVALMGWIQLSLAALVVIVLGYWLFWGEDF